MPLVSFGEFGAQDKELYKVYLRANVQYAEYTQGKGSDAWRSMALRYSSFADVCDQGVRGLVSEGGGEQFERGANGDIGGERCGDGFVSSTVREVFDGSSEGDGVGSVRVVGETSGRGAVGMRESWFRNVIPEEECDVMAGRGKHWKKNQRKKLNRRGRVNADAGPGLGLGSESVSNVEINVDTGSRRAERSVEQKPKDALRLSLEEKWRVENELKIAKAKKELDLLQSEDREAIKKLRDRKVQGATERTMVQIEKAHASLVQTGNVPGVQPGFCQTVVDGEIVESVPGLSGSESKGCSISPSSSISEREVREMKKELEDWKLKYEKLERKQKRMPLAFRVALGEEDVPVSMVGGRVPESAKEALDEVIGEEEWTYEGDEDANPNLLYLRKELLF